MLRIKHCRQIFGCLARHCNGCRDTIGLNRKKHIMPVAESITLGNAVGFSNQRPIRVLHALGQLQRGGIETWLYHLGRNLKHRGIDCHILARTDQPEPFTKEFCESGLNVLPCLGERNPLRYFQNFRRIIAEHGPYDILHSHGPSLSTLQLSAYARMLGIRSILLHSHSDLRPQVVLKGLKYKLYSRTLVHLGRSLATYRVACSSDAAVWMYGPMWREHPRTQVVPLGINFEPFFSPKNPGIRASIGIPQGRFVIGHVGRFVPVKNHNFLVHLAETLLSKSPDFHFLLVGDGPLRTNIQAAIQTRRITDHFTFIPDSNAVPSLMSNAMDVFVFPSYYEGFGLVTVEAQAAGIPCLIADNITTECIVDPGLVTRLNIHVPPEVWASQIIALRTEGHVKHDPVEHRKRILASKFDIDASVSAFANLYQQLVRNSNDTIGDGLR